MKRIAALLLALLLAALCVGCGQTEPFEPSPAPSVPSESQTAPTGTEAPVDTEAPADPAPSLSPAPGDKPDRPAALVGGNGIPAYSDSPYVVLNNNQPEFDPDLITTDSYTFFSELDDLGRCGVTYACLGTELMPTEPRGSISSVKPTGWQSVQYDFVEGGNLYNRCHLIGFQLSGENANPRNLITGTRYLNTAGMLPFEDLVHDYMVETENHVMYRVTPVFSGRNLVADGVIMEGWSVEDEGEGICFNVFCYNVQPGVVIDYADGTNRPAGDYSDSSAEQFVANTNSRRFHRPQCSAVEKISKENRWDVTCPREQLVEQGYLPCKICEP